MLDAAEVAGVTHLSGTSSGGRRSGPSSARAIADGAIGEPRLCTFVQYVPLVADPEAKVPTWWFDPGAGGGWLGASGSHIVDQVRTWLGEFASVERDARASCRTAPTSRRTRSRCGSASRSGVEGVLQQTAAAWGPYAGITKVAGTDGTLWLDGEDGVARRRATARADSPVPADLALPPAPEESDDPRHRFTHLELGPYTRLCEVLRAGVEGRPLPDAVPCRRSPTASPSMRVLDAIRASAASGWRGHGSPA